MKKSIPIAIGLVFIGISIYLSFNFESVVKKSIFRTDFSWVISTILLRAVIVVAFARGTQLIIDVFQSRLKSIFSFLIALPLGFGVSFISPIYEFDYGDYSTKERSVDHISLTELTDGNYQIKTSPYLLVFFSTDCPHCKTASKLIGFNRSIGNAPEVIALFPGTQENADQFIAENNGQDFTYYIVDDRQYFLDNSGAAFPSIFLIDANGNTLAHWFGDHFNYTALDYIESFSK